MDDKEWLRNPCLHAWYLGPLTDKLMRHRPAVCIRCWMIKKLPECETFDIPLWTEAMYEQHKDEIERRFFGG